MDVINPIKELSDWTVPILDNVPVIRGVIGVILVFFTPGFAWTLILFKRINRIERLVLSFALSLALVTLSILGLNVVINMRITGLNAFLTILVLTVIPLLIYITRRYTQKRKMRQSEEE
jgi:uncharacterized membrane protein